MPRTRPPYPEEFRREAIRLALLGDKTQRQLARTLGPNLDVDQLGRQPGAGAGRRLGRSSDQALAGAPARTSFTASVVIACRFSAH